MISSLDPVRRTVNVPRIRDTDTWRSQVFPKQGYYNEFVHTPKNKEPSHYWVDTYHVSEYPKEREIVQNGGGQVETQPEVQPENDPNLVIQASPIPHEPKPEEPIQNKIHPHSGKFNEHYATIRKLDDLESRLYGGSRISPSKRRPQDYYQLPSLAEP